MIEMAACWDQLFCSSGINPECPRGLVGTINSGSFPNAFFTFVKAGIDDDYSFAVQQKPGEKIIEFAASRLSSGKKLAALILLVRSAFLAE